MTQPDPVNQSHHTERPADGYTVLVVDDEEAVRRLAVRMLTWTGYQALEARHGREALVTIEQHSGPIHLVLTDIKMPGMNGRELGRHVERRWPGKPILYMSGFPSEVFQGGLLEAGAPFLAKPFTQEDLAAKVRELLEGRVSSGGSGGSAGSGGPDTRRSPG
jgi:two-component system cell cycle sensor histidine kinase/response regulator CckA